ncbi:MULTISPECIES: ABC transporter ATP-binding protein [Bacillus cereus group]|uniref:Bacitracin ABC transporter ATP-binding protein n=1 Tax=Bacillus thuringiensis serovar mexicanensis TaxID=180868 RepID=A0A242W6N0_BACTU|nr:MULTISPECIES: ABC transporter ATP-binding protein [Bacillus cereus group]EEM57225.1 ABC transporter-related protein [Bacillus thuringiensis serovar monterrey BGSC 4AJ1]MEB9671982.1 ABC transporter ATP-binding protein [Bacillus anthracis]OTW47089.1 bacitracin ABC transporter ATP-binding protein [Bacillus thuringiensis serovar mexicanensis]OTX04616.1 bacitracin ABC transporter ATP-binding protein [Bacillus thuringiensis serovar monterrey]
MQRPVVDVKNVQKVYGKKGENQSYALKGVSFSIREGEFVGIMGPSGSGKTTLLNVISTLDHATDGKVEIAGTDITKMRQGALSDFRSKKLGFIFQDFNLLENLSIYENIALPLSLQSVPSRKIGPKVTKVAEMLGISAILKKYPSEISGGQKQRSAAARALVHEPAIILGDEPTGALDSKNATSLLDAMKSLNEEQNVSIMMVTHDPFSASYCQRILFIQDGELYRELHRTTNREMFYKEILNVLADLGTQKA